MSKKTKRSGQASSSTDIDEPSRDAKTNRSWDSEVEQTVRAIQDGEIDALVVRGQVNDKLYALKSFDELERAASERGVAEVALRASEQRFETLAAHAPVGIFMNDAAGNWIYVNPRCAEILGMSPQDAMGQGWMNALHPEDRDRVLRQRHQAVTTGDLFEADFRFCPRNGANAWVATSSVALPDEDGMPAGRLGTILDITDRKTAELALKETNQRMQTVLDASPLSILSMDPAGRILGWNRGAERMFGWSEKEALGRVCPTVPDEELDDFHDMIRRVLAGEAFAGKVRYRRKKSGEPVRAAISAGPLIDGSGEKIGIVAILEDVTEREQAGEQLHALIEERERLMQDLHDSCIQSVYAIGLNLEECQRQVDQSPAKAARMIAEATASLNLVIQDLRSYITGNRREITGWRELQTEIEKVIHASGEHGPALAVDVDAAAVSLLAPDQTLQLLQIVREGVSNIVRHANARTGGVSLQLQDEAVCLEVSDDGDGFDPDSQTGEGLGLHHISARARKIGGRWRVISAPGQ